MARRRCGLLASLLLVLPFVLGSIPILSGADTYGKIAFCTGTEIYVMNSDGSNPVFFTEGENPAWSPDGRKIAFEYHDQIYIINTDGSEKVNLTPYPADHHAPTWSPDGRKIAFVSDRDGNDEIYVQYLRKYNLMYQNIKFLHTSQHL